VIPLESFRKNINLTRLNNNQPIGDYNVNYLKDILVQMDSDALDLLNRFLDLNVTRRITALDALSHPFFKQESSASSQSTATASGSQSRDYLENTDPFDSLNTISNKDDGSLGGVAGAKYASDEENVVITSPASANQYLNDKFADVASVFQPPNILKRKRLQSINNNNANFNQTK
jgi:serine/threonine protein kinase